MVSNEEDYDRVQTFFRDNLPEADFDTLDFWGKVYYCQSYSWMHLMRQEFALCYRYNPAVGGVISRAAPHDRGQRAALPQGAA